MYVTKTNFIDLALFSTLFCIVWGDESVYPTFPTPLNCTETGCSQSDVPDPPWRSCSCDPGCARRGTCCPDAIDPASIEDGGIEWLCVKTSKYGVSGHLLRSTCKRDWKNGRVAENCLLDGKNTSDPFNRIPVTSRATNVTYKNVFCAICNDDLDFLIWQMAYDCPYLYSNVTSVKEAAEVCEEVFNFPNTLNSLEIKPKSCGIYKEECPFGTPQTLSEKCRTYIEPVRSNDDYIIFKNRFCAACNGVNASQLECFQFSFMHDVRVSFTPIFKPSFPIIVDFNFQTKVNLVGHIRKCPGHQIYDPWKEVCRDFFCEDCSDIAKHITLKCPLKLSFSHSEYIVDGSGNVTILDSIVPIPLDSHEIINDTLLICADNLLLEKFGVEYGYLSLAMMIVCIVSLCVKLVVDILTSPPLQRSARMVTCFSLALLLASTLLFFGQNQVGNEYVCFAIGVTTHYFYLASFFWLNVIAFDIWKAFTFIKSTRSSALSKKYCIYSWIFPFLFVGAGLILEFVDFGSTIHDDILKPNYGKLICWISNKMALFVLFAVPLMLILVANIFFFISTVTCIVMARSQASLVYQNSKNDKVDLVLFLKLATMMGLTWIFGFLAAFLNIDVFWYLFTILNNLMGPFILYTFWPKHACRDLRALVASLSGQIKTSTTIVSKL